MSDVKTIENTHRESIFTLAFAEDGKHILSGGGDGLIRTWRVEDGMQIQEPIIANVGLGPIVVSKDHKWIVRTEQNRAIVWDKKTRLRVLTVTDHTKWVLAVDIASDSARFVTGAMDSKVFIWDIRTGQRLVGPLRHVDHLTAVKFSPDGNNIATSIWNRMSLRIYHSYSGQWLRTIPVATSLTNPIVWSNDSQHIFSLSTIARISKSCVATGACLGQWTVPGMNERTFVSIALSSNGKFIASFMGQCLTFWDASTGAQLGPTLEHSGRRLNTMALSPDDNYVAIGGEDGIIVIRNLTSILPPSYFSGQVGQQPQPECCTHIQREIESLRDDVENMRATMTRFNDRIWKSLLEMNVVLHHDDHSG